MFYLPVAGVEIPLWAIIFVGFTVGVVGGFIGVGGGYMVTPALIVFGFPGYMASGIDITHIAGKSVVSSIRHWQLGNVDVVMGLAMVAGTFLGVDMGIRMLTYFKKLGISDLAILIASTGVLFAIFFYTQIETSRAHKEAKRRLEEGGTLKRDLVLSKLALWFQALHIYPLVKCPVARIVISQWTLVMVGVVTGVLAGFLGVGGGFIRVPSLIYVIGSPTHIAVGTDLLEIVASAGYGTIKHTLAGNVDFICAIYMIMGAMIGAQIGSLGTLYVRGPAIRYILSYSLILACIGALMRLIYVWTSRKFDFLAGLAVTLTLGEMIFLCSFIGFLIYFSLRYRAGKWIPDWAVPLVVKVEKW